MIFKGFSLNLSSGRFPDLEAWKVFSIVPIPKRNEHEGPSNQQWELYDKASDPCMGKTIWNMQTQWWCWYPLPQIWV